MGRLRTDIFAGKKKHNSAFVCCKSSKTCRLSIQKILTVKASQGAIITASSLWCMNLRSALDISRFLDWSIMVESWRNRKDSTFSQFSHIFPLSLCNPSFGTTPQVFLFSVVHWAVTPQLLSLYCFSVPRSLHKTLKEHLKGELKLQLSIRMIERLNVTVTFMYCLCNLAGCNSRQPCSLGTGL